MRHDEILGKLEGVRRSGQGHIAKCPAHGDRRQSLSVGRGSDRTLLKCHAGCEPQDICGAIGISLRDLFDEPQANGSRDENITRTYDYQDEQGNLLYQVVRRPGKEFRQRRPDGRGGWEWRLGDVRRVPYRLPELISSQGWVVIAEGEKDVASLVSRGFTATCCAGGANAWKPEHRYPEFFRGRWVAVIPDNDQAGCEYAMTVANSLAGVAAGVRVVQLTGLPEKGDVTDWFHGDHDERELIEIVKATKNWVPGTVLEPILLDRSIDIEHSAIRVRGEERGRDEIAARAMSFNVSFLDDRCRALLPHDLIVLGAETGSGKTQLATIIAQSNAAIGKRIVYLALEGEPLEIERRMKYRRIVDLAFKARDKRVYGITYADWYLRKFIEVDDEYGPQAEDEISREFRTLRTVYRGKNFGAAQIDEVFELISQDTDLVVLDHLHYVDTKERDENKAQKRVIMTVRDASLAAGIPVIAIAHLRKRNKKTNDLVPDVQEFMGSSDITKVATRVIVLGRARDVEQTDPLVAHTYMRVDKDRIGGWSSYVGLLDFDIVRNDYRPSYTLGKLSMGGDEFEHIDYGKIPNWARSARGRAAA